VVVPPLDQGLKFVFAHIVLPNDGLQRGQLLSHHASSCVLICCVRYGLHLFEQLAQQPLVLLAEVSILDSELLLGDALEPLHRAVPKAGHQADGRDRRGGDQGPEATGGSRATGECGKHIAGTVSDENTWLVLKKGADEVVVAR